MSNYKQSPVTGESWQRAVRVVIENPVDGTPAISFIEEQVINLPGEKITRPAGNVAEPFMPENYLEQFNVINPETGEVIRTATYQEVYVVLHSLYLHVAAKRDLANQPAPEPQPEPQP